MAKLLKLRRGTTAQHGSFTGAEGEVTVDTDKDSLVVHNGSTAGGFPIARSPATAGTVGVSEVVQVDANKDASGFRNITATGELDAATLDISGDADIDGTLEADAITVDGTALNEYISDTVGAMVGSNTETGIAVTYEDSDNTLDFSITSIPGVTFTGDVSFDNGTNAGKDITWDESDNALEFADDVKAVFGTDADSEIYHNDTDLYIDNDKGSIKIRSNVASDVGGDIHLMPHDDEYGIKILHDDAVELYYNGVKKVETSASGITLSGGWSSTSDCSMPDNGSITFGAGQDMLVVSDGTKGVIRSGTAGGEIHIQNNASSIETMAKFIGNGGVELLYNDVKHFETQDGGIKVSGGEGQDSIIDLWCDEGDDDADKWRVLSAQADNKFKIQHYGAGSWVTETELDASGNLVATGNVTAYSDSRLKTDVDTIENALDKVSKLRGVSFTKVDTQERGIGVIAQEIEEVIPEVVQDGAYKSVAYGNIVGVLIEAIKELKSEIEELKGGK